MATLHGANLMDTPYRTTGGMLHWLDVVCAEAGATLVQEPPGRFREHGHDDWQVDPELTEMTLDGHDRWSILRGPESLTVSGGLVGGCIETLGPLSGSRYLDATAYAQQHTDDALLDSLGPLAVPVVADVECGHVAPFMPIVNGSLGTMEVSAHVNRLTQTLV